MRDYFKFWAIAAWSKEAAKRTLDYAGGMISGIAFAGMIGLAVAQGAFIVPNSAIVVGHLNFSPVFGAPGLPVGTTCTITAGSTDTFGSCAASAGTATITFGTSWGVAPRCILLDSTATPVGAYTVSATAITVSATTNAHVLFWFCGGNVGSV